MFEFFTLIEQMYIVFFFMFTKIILIVQSYAPFVQFSVCSHYFVSESILKALDFCWYCGNMKFHEAIDYGVMQYKF